MKTRLPSLGLIGALVFAVLAWLPGFLSADPPASLLRNSFTTNAPGKAYEFTASSTTFQVPLSIIPGGDGTIYRGGNGFGFNGTAFVWTNAPFSMTNPITANTILCGGPTQVTNCSANPTFTGLAGVSNGLEFHQVVYLLPNGSDRTWSCTIPNVLFPDGQSTGTLTNGTVDIFSIGGVGGSFTGAVIKPFYHN